MFSLPGVSRMPNGSDSTNILCGRPAPWSSVDSHGIKNDVYGRQSYECNNSASEERASASNSDSDGNGVAIDRINSNTNGIEGQRHKAGSLGPSTAISDLFCLIENKPIISNDHLLNIKDESDVESHSLVINIGDSTLGGSIAQPLNSLHNWGSADKAPIGYMCMTQMQSCFELCVGHGCQIPRWRNSSEICYVICTESFETPAAAASVAAAMTEAISMWGEIMGVVFKEVGRNAPAAFRIRYKKNHSSHHNVYAKAFLPTDRASSLVVYQKALDNSSYLADILAHELGNILGPRHEFALKTEGFLPCVRFGSENHQSIMNYFDHPSKLQVGRQDREELAAFYAYGRADYRGLPIVDVTPPLRHNW